MFLPSIPLTARRQYAARRSARACAARVSAPLVTPLVTPLTAPLAALLVGAAIAGPPPAHAATAAAAPPPALALAASENDRDAQTRELTERLVLDRAASLAASQRRSFAREATLLGELEQRDKQLRRVLAQQNQNAAESARLRSELRALTSERQRLVDELGARDSAYRAELAEYRRLIAALADSPNPERRQALQRYADGDRLGAFAVLEELTRAEEAAREKANQLRTAAEYRQLAALAADMQDRGEKTTHEVLQLWREAAKRDADDFWTWVYLSRLTQQAGDTAQALHAADAARRAATDDRERSIAASELGDVQQAAGAAARRSFDQSLQIARRLADANPASAQAQRDVSVSLERLGDVQQAAGDLAAARRSFDQSLQIRRRLADANPASAQAQRDVAASLWRLAAIGGQVSWRQVADALLALQARGVLPPADQPLVDEARRRAAGER